MSEKVFWAQHSPIERRAQEIAGSGTDRGLSEFGVEHAKRLAKRLARVATTLTDLNETIVTSPLRRATETSEIIADELDFTVIVDYNLRAQHFGDLEGRTIPEILADPRLAPHLHRNLPDNELFTDMVPNGESIEDATNRMITARTKLFAADGSPLVVTHGSVLNTMIGTTRGLTVRQWKDISAEFKGQIIQDSGAEISGIELPTNTLIVLRGNSGSGKSTVAIELRDKLGDKVMLISKDTIKDEFISPDSPDYYEVLADIIRNIATIGMKRNYTVIIDGVVGRPKHDGLLFDLIDKFDKGFVYSMDIPFEETLRRHATRPKSQLFGEEEMKKWYRQHDHLGVDNENIIDHTKSRDEIVQLILDQMKED